MIEKNYSLILHKFSFGGMHMDTVQEIKALVDAKKGEFLDAADKVWSYAERGFK